MQVDPIWPFEEILFNQEIKLLNRRLKFYAVLDRVAQSKPD